MFSPRELEFPDFDSQKHLSRYIWTIACCWKWRKKGEYVSTNCTLVDPAWIRRVWGDFTCGLTSSSRMITPQQSIKKPHKPWNVAAIVLCSNLSQNDDLMFSYVPCSDCYQGGLHVCSKPSDLAHGELLLSTVPLQVNIVVIRHIFKKAQPLFFLMAVVHQDNNMS